MSLNFNSDPERLADFAKELQREIEQVQEELTQKRDKGGEDHRCKELEEKTAVLLNRFVVAQRFESSTDFDSLANGLYEVLETLVGVQKFVAYMAEDKYQDELIKVMESDDDSDQFPQTIRRGEGDLGSAAEKTEAFVATTGRTATADGKNPICTVPIMVRGELHGFIAIYKLFEHKGGFNEVDNEVFDMLSQCFGPSALSISKSDISKYNLKDFADVVRNARNIRTLTL